MNIKRPLVPGFLKRAEQKLLLNKPGIWSTRTHLVVYYGILFLLLLTILCFLEPNDLRDDSTTDAWIGFVAVISGVSIIVWLIYLLRFNVFKKYGIIHPLHGLVTFLFYFIATGVIISFNYVHPVIESVRANLAYSDDEIVRDINDINVKILQLENDLLKEPWNYDRIQLIDTVKQEAKQHYPVYDSVTHAYIPHYELDSAKFYSRLAETDSMIRLKDSEYLVYSTPDFTNLSVYRANYYSGGHLLSDFEVFNKAYGHPLTPAQREVASSELKKLIEKYKYFKYEGPYAEVAIEADAKPDEIVRKKYHLVDVDNGISHIVEKKYRWNDNDLSAYFRIFYYVTLGITLLIFIFRHTTVRTFFLTVLAGVLLTIFTAMILAFSGADAIHFLSFMIAYTFVFFIGSLSIWRDQKRKAIAGIMLNLFVFTVTALPILVLAWYYEFRRHEQFFRNSPPYNIEDYVPYAEFTGALLLLVLLATYISKTYRRWYSLPQE